MAKKKEQLSFQIECKSEPQWRILMKREGLIVVDVYSGWAGPCISISNFLRRIKGEINDNKLTFATACADKIDDLRKFRDQSEPIWLFIAGGGKPVRVMQGCHVPNLAKAIKDEFDHEILCINGKARRNPISLEGDSNQKKKKVEPAKAAASAAKPAASAAKPAASAAKPAASAAKPAASAAKPAASAAKPAASAAKPAASAAKPAASAAKPATPSAAKPATPSAAKPATASSKASGLNKASATKSKSK